MIAVTIFTLKLLLQFTILVTFLSVCNKDYFFFFLFFDTKDYCYNQDDFNILSSHQHKFRHGKRDIMVRPKVNLSHNYNMNSKIIKDLTTKIHVRSRQNIATLNWKWWKRKLDNNSCMYKKSFIF